MKELTRAGTPGGHPEAPVNDSTAANSNNCTTKKGKVQPRYQVTIDRTGNVENGHERPIPS